jgi:hypothetical protein
MVLPPDHVRFEVRRTRWGWGGAQELRAGMAATTLATSVNWGNERVKHPSKDWFIGCCEIILTCGAVPCMLSTVLAPSESAHKTSQI